MSRQPIHLRVDVEEGWRFGAGLQVYTDFGTGTIDTSKPLLARPHRFHRNHQRPRPMGQNPWGSVPFGSRRPRVGGSGWGRYAFGTANWVDRKDSVDLEVLVPDGHGNWKFAVQAVDEESNVQGDPLLETTMTVSGRDPAPLRGFGLSGYDGPSDRITFVFNP